MISKLRHSVTYANVVATMALFIALGGSAYAAFKLPKNSVGAAQLKNNAVTAPKVKAHSLLAKDFKKGQLPAGPQGVQGAAGQKGEPGAPGPLLETLPSGKTLYGTYSITGHAVGEANDRGSTQISLSTPLAAAPAETVLVPLGAANPAPTKCPGSAAAPAAAAGTLCVYEAQRTNAEQTKVCSVVAEGLCGPGIGGVADRFGAAVITFAVGNGSYDSWGTWAVTAP